MACDSAYCPLSSGRAGDPDVGQNRLLFKKQVISEVSVVESAWRLVRPALEAKSHPLRLEMSVAKRLLESDPVRVSQFLMNLPAIQLEQCGQGQGRVLGRYLVDFLPAATPSAFIASASDCRVFQ